MGDDHDRSIVGVVEPDYAIDLMEHSGDHFRRARLRESRPRAKAPSPRSTVTTVEQVQHAHRNLERQVREGNNRQKLAWYLAVLWDVERLEAKVTREYELSDQIAFEKRHRDQITELWDHDLHRINCGKPFNEWVDHALTEIAERKWRLLKELEQLNETIAWTLAELAHVTGIARDFVPCVNTTVAKQLVDSLGAELNESNYQIDRLRELVEMKLYRRRWAALSPTTRRELAPVTLNRKNARELYGELKTLFGREVRKALLGIKRTLPEMRAALAGLDDVELKVAGDRCPLCGGNLARRTRAYDGEQFIACDGDPSCIYTWSIELGDRAAMRDLAITLSIACDNSTAASAWRIAGLQDEQWLTSHAACYPRVHDAKTWLWILAVAQDISRISDIYNVTLGLSGHDPVIEKAWRAWLYEEDDHTRACDRLDCTQAASDDKIADRKVNDIDMGVTTNTTTTTATSGQSQETATTTIGDILTAGLGMASEDVADATWRTAAGEAIELAKVPVKAAMKRVTGFTKPVAKFLHDAVDTQLGEGALAITLGFGIAAYAPLCDVKLGPRTTRLSKELRVWGFEKFTSRITKFMIAPIRKELTALVESLPSFTT